jgi:hypothetical protein
MKHGCQWRETEIDVPAVFIRGRVFFHREQANSSAFAQDV